MRLARTKDVDQLGDHFCEHASWGPSTRKYSFLLTLEDAPGLLGEAVSSIHGALDDIPGLIHVPQQWLHLTMTGLGECSTIAADQLQEISDQVFGHWAPVPSPELVLDTLFIAEESLMFFARDESWLHELTDVLRTTADDVLGARAWSRLRPHISVAYASRATRIEPLVQRLAPVAAAVDDEVRLRPRLSLVELERTGNVYHWRVLRQQ